MAEAAKNPVLGPEDDGPSDYERLLRFVLGAPRRFSLALARCDQPRLQEALFLVLERDAEAAGRHLGKVRLVEDSRSSVIDQIRSAVLSPAGSTSDVVLVTVPDGLLIDTNGRPKPSPELLVLNRDRDRLPRDLPFPIVLWTSSAGARALATKARDLDAVALSRVEFSAPEAPILERQAPFAAPWLSPPRDAADEQRIRRDIDLLERIAANAPNTLGSVEALQSLGFLHARLGHPDAAITSLRRAIHGFDALAQTKWAANLRLLLADLLRLYGRTSEALELCADVLTVFERLGDPLGRARAASRIAELLQFLGDLDNALRLYREEALPAFERLGVIDERAMTLGKIAGILHSRGDLDEALRIRKEEELPVYARINDARLHAVTLGKIADIHQDRGELDEALRIRREEELPVYEHLGDVHSRAVTLGKMVDIFLARGELDEALRVLRKEVLPTLENLGDVRSRAVSLGKVADVLHARGELDEALRIRKEEELPVYERLGDVYSRAVTLGKIADILQARGECDEAIRIRKEDELLAYERLGALHALLVGRTNLALDLLGRGRAGDREEAEKLLRLALPVAVALKLSEAQHILRIASQHGLEIGGSLGKETG